MEAGYVSIIFLYSHFIFRSFFAGLYHSHLSHPAAEVPPSSDLRNGEAHVGQEQRNWESGAALRRAAGSPGKASRPLLVLTRWPHLFGSSSDELSCGTPIHKVAESREALMDQEWWSRAHPLPVPGQGTRPHIITQPQWPCGHGFESRGTHLLQPARLPRQALFLCW